ncbi:MAG: hypothetical protein ABSG86_30150, partial [Thermoguttaceae bacterium]
ANALYNRDFFFRGYIHTRQINAKACVIKGLDAISRKKFGLDLRNQWPGRAFLVGTTLASPGPDRSCH